MQDSTSSGDLFRLQIIQTYDIKKYIEITNITVYVYIMLLVYLFMCIYNIIYIYIYICIYTGPGIDDMFACI